MPLRDLSHTTYNVWLRVSERYHLRQQKRVDCAHGEWWLWLMQSVSTETPCWSVALVIGWKVESCFVSLDSLNNFIGDHLLKLEHVPA